MKIAKIQFKTHRNAQGLETMWLETMLCLSYEVG